MTKKQWFNLRVGHKVKTETNSIDFNNGAKMTKVTLVGTIVKFNSNCSQVLVKWNDNGFENWAGRLTLETIN